MPVPAVSGGAIGRIIVASSGHWDGKAPRSQQTGVSTTGAKMFDSQSFRARAAQCRRRAENAKTESEKRTWAMLAQRWLELLDGEVAEISGGRQPWTKRLTPKTADCSSGRSPRKRE